jgi:hypothetical protein
MTSNGSWWRRRRHWTIHNRRDGRWGWRWRCWSWNINWRGGSPGLFYRPGRLDDRLRRFRNRLGRFHDRLGLDHGRHWSGLNIRYFGGRLRFSLLGSRRGRRLRRRPGFGSCARGLLSWLVGLFSWARLRIPCIVSGIIRGAAVGNVIAGRTSQSDQHCRQN